MKATSERRGIMHEGAGVRRLARIAALDKG